MPPLPPVYEEQIADMQRRLRAGEFTLEQMPGYVKGRAPSTDVWHRLDHLEVYPRVWGRECGKNGIGRLREVVLTEITEAEKFPYHDLDPEYFPKMADAYSSIDIPKMADQSLAYEQALESQGVVVHRVRFPQPPVSAYGPSKSTWAAAELFVLRGGSVLPKRGVQPLAYGRAEYLALWAWTRLGVPVLFAVTGKGIFEIGPCSFLAEDVFISGNGMAFNDDGLAQVKPVVARSAGLDVDDMTFLHVEFPGSCYYDAATGTSHHPDLLLAALDVDKVIAYPPGLDFATLEWLRTRGYARRGGGPRGARAVRAGQRHAHRAGPGDNARRGDREHRQGPPGRRRGHRGPLLGVHEGGRGPALLHRSDLAGEGPLLHRPLSEPRKVLNARRNHRSPTRRRAPSRGRGERSLMPKEVINPEGLWDSGNRSYSHVVKFTKPESLIFVAGMAGVGPDLAVVSDDIRDQTRRCFELIAKELEAGRGHAGRHLRHDRVPARHRQPQVAGARGAVGVLR